MTAERDARILVVDDNLQNIALVQAQLERAGYAVIPALGGQAGIDAAIAQHPDLVLLDIMMPGMDGYETIRAIRDLDQIRHIPILAVTAKAMKGDREKCLASGASDYIAKPVDLDQLFSLMRVWVYERRNRVAARTSV